MSPYWGTTDAEIRVPFAENPELSKVLCLEPGVGDNVALHALPAARNYALSDCGPPHPPTSHPLPEFYLSAFSFHSTSFSFLFSVLFQCKMIGDVFY